MAESCNTAFGRYLKILRERRGLSLDDVRSLSETFPETLNKGYLSRCENGHHRLAFPKLIPLSRIYEVPAEVLVERMELDLELDRIGGPDTTGLTYSELRSRSLEANIAGRLWDAYGFVRDAVVRAKTDDVNPVLVDSTEQYLAATTNCATMASALGRRALALHEFEFVRDAPGLGPRIGALIEERLSECYRREGRLDLARAHANNAVDKATAESLEDLLGYGYAVSGLVELEAGKPSDARSQFQKAYRAFRRSGNDHDCARTLNNLAQTYFQLERFRTAKRALQVAQEMATKVDQPRIKALSRILLGEIAVLEKKPSLAEHHFKSAATIGRSNNDRMVRFKADFWLLKVAVKEGRTSAARAIRRRLTRLAPWVPDDLVELQEFRKLVS